MKAVIVALLLALSVSNASADPHDDVKITAVQAHQLKQLGDRLLYSLKVDIQNTGEPGNIFVNVVGLDSNGFQLALKPMYAYFEAGQAKALTGETLINPQNGEVARWEVATFGKSSHQ